MSTFALVTLLDSVLGQGKRTTDSNIAYHCPFCHHHKPKLELNTDSQYWHCWVCNTSGRKLYVLLRKLNVDRSIHAKLSELLDDVKYQPKVTTTNTEIIQLPTEYQPLWKLDKLSPEYRNAVHYLKRRDIGIADILRYRIGYCTGGMYSGKLIIPSYDANGALNYFVSRAYYNDDTFKHKNPRISKDIIGFELHVNWNMPIILVEGAFDAIAVRRNAIPLFGKVISNTLKSRIVEQGVKEIYICLDQDARKQALAAAEYFMNNGIIVYFVELTDKDPSDLGFKKMSDLIDSTLPLTTEVLMKERILCELLS